MTGSLSGIGGVTVDERTIQAYDRAAADFAEEWQRQPPPVDLQALLRTHFRPGPTADIGCGSGRDTAWLSAAGFPTTGYDASRGLLAEARRRYPRLEFHWAALPELEGIPLAAFSNVLCETVIMHLDPRLVHPSVRRLLAILKPGGALYLSWRVTRGTDRRDERGRLYAAFDSTCVTDALSNTIILHNSETVSASSQKAIHRVIARKAPVP